MKAVFEQQKPNEAYRQTLKIKSETRRTSTMDTQILVQLQIILLGCVIILVIKMYDTLTAICEQKIRI